MLTLGLLSALVVHAGPIKLASTTFQGVNVKDDIALFWTDHFAQQLSSSDVKIITSGEIAGLLGLERQKQLIGCSEAASSCLAELANALGVDGLVRGSVGKFGDTYQVNVRIVAAADGHELAKFSATVTGDQAVLEALTRGAHELHDQLIPPAPTTTGKVRTLSWIPAAAGVIGVAVGAGLLVSAQGRVDALAHDDASSVGPSPIVYASGASSLRTGGIAACAVGGVAIAAGIAMFAFGGSTDVTPVVMLSPNGAVAGVTGQW